MARARRARARWLLLLGLALSPEAPVAFAQDHDASYESDRLQRYLDAAGLTAHPDPEGKRVREVRIVRREVLEADDLRVPIVLPERAPTWPNHLHVLTAELIVAREVLLREGQPFRAEVADESMRNLRALGLFALVRIVAVKARDAGEVIVVVYTRDLWSLRLESGFSGAGNAYSLGAQLIERNFLGRGKALAVRFALDPFDYSVGETYLDPRVYGERLRLLQSFDAIVLRDSGELTGGVGALRFGRPFYDTPQRFSFDLVASYAQYVARDTSDARVLGVGTAPGSTFGGDCRVGTTGCVARVWQERRTRLEAAAHRRAGRRYTQTFTLGAGLWDRRGRADAQTGLRAGQQEAFEREVLPPARRDVYPLSRYRLDLPRFATFSNLATFGQSETVQTGPRLDLSLATPLAALGSLHDALVTRGALAYVLAVGSALAEVELAAGARLQRRVIDELGVLRARLATPPWPWHFGRLVLRGSWEGRRADSQRTLVALGGDDALRGYPSAHFYGYGASRAFANLEYRTRPLVLSSVHLGLVAFYDAGSVYRSLATARVHHDVGLGVRVLFPQFNRYVFRADFGVPLDQSGFAVVASYGSAQLVPLTADEDALAAAGSGVPR